MATFTLGQMLEIALGSSRAGAVDFEQLHNLLNALLLHLGLRDLLVQENGEPLEGAEESPFAFLKDLKERMDTNEKEIAELRALCQELREEINVVKLEQSQMAEDMQFMQQNFNMERFQNMMDELRNQMMESLMAAMKEMLGLGPSSRDKKSGQLLPDSEDDGGLIVIGNEIPLVEKPKAPKRGESQPASPGSKTEGKEKDEAASSDVLSIGESDTGQSDTAQSRARGAMAQRGVGQKDMRQNVQRGDTGQSDTEQKDTGVGRALRWSSRGRMDVGQDDMGQDDMGQKDMRRSVQRSDAGQSDMGQKDMRRSVPRSDAGQSDMGQKGVGKSVRWRDRGGTDMGQDDMGQDDMGEDDMGQDDMEQIKKEEMEIDISEVEALPSSLDSFPEMTSTGEIKEEETKMGISKAPPHAQTKSSDGTTSETHPRAPGSRSPVQKVQSVRGHPGSPDLWVPAESVAGTSRGVSATGRLPTPKEARGEGGIRMETYPAEPGLMFLRVPSSEYAPCDPLVKMSQQRSGLLPSTPPASPGLSMRLPRLRRPEQRDEAAEGYSRRSPMYSGGKHTSASPVQRMEPLLPDPNLPGTVELMGKDGVVYRGRIVPE